ncbi:MAG: NCS2 family permease [Lachnospiraceae bacterium]|nr:NCS2 family permease [Lachnospiraceae bacterium]
MEHLFRLTERKTDVRTEIMAGITTYFAMIYVISIIVAMMTETGMPEEAAYTSVLFASGMGCIIMGLLANYPVALAPSLGVTALFSSTLCGRMGYSWQAGLCAIFIAGIFLLLITATRVRKAILMAIPTHLRNAISAGIGFFLTFVGLKNCGIIVNSEQNLVALGKIFHAEVIVSIFGIVVLLALFIRKNKFPMILGMLITAFVGLIAGLFSNNPGLPRIPESFSLFQASTANFGAFVSGFQELFSSPNVILVFISILFVDFFDTTGTLIAVINRSKFPTIDGESENFNRAFVADALGSIVGAVLGTTSVSSYMESETGIESGGRTGLTAVTAGVLFLISVFLYPIFSLMTVCVTSPVLILVGSMMIRQFAQIDWRDFVEAVSSFTTVIMMVLTYSIADGIAFGFIIYGLTALFNGRYKEVTPLMWVMVGMFSIYFLLI